jgi:hypothetical protein
MPNTPSPIDGPLGPFWTPVLQSTQASKAKAAGLAAQAQQGATYDRYLNVTSLSGSNLNQVVQIGGVSGDAGVFVGTGFASGTSGIATPSNVAAGRITCSANSNEVTLDSTASGTFAVGQQIGAYILNASGTTTDAILPGSVIASISGSTLTLTPPAPASWAVVLTGSGLYCAACDWTLL